MKRILMITTAWGSPNGINVVKYEAGAELDVPKDLAKVFTDDGSARYVAAEQAAPTHIVEPETHPVDDPPQQTVAPPSSPPVETAPQERPMTALEKARAAKAAAKAAKANTNGAPENKALPGAQETK